MAQIKSRSAKDTKCYYTSSLLPSYVDEKALPTKKKPFSTILAHPFVHTIDVILPEDVFEVIETEITGDAGMLRYQRVNMRLEEIISGEFFNHYIKTGNILMLSEGRPGIDNTFSLRDGIISLELDKATYERCGLTGKPVQDFGKKHSKSRFVIEFNLRLPSMLHGKKGFERIVWAFQNVLNQSLSWLFLELGSSDNPNGPIDKYHPSKREVSPEVLYIPQVNIPSWAMRLDAADALNNPANAEEVFEWLGLAFLDSPRIRKDDVIDPFLCRYSVPYQQGVDTESITVGNLVRLRWHAFVHPTAITNLWLQLCKRVDESWAAMGVSCYGNASYTLLQAGPKLNLEWLCE